MSRNPTWKRDAKGVEHPARETLLACIREQCPEQEKNSINEHLLSGCAPCNLLHDDLKQSSHELNYLKNMSRYLYYPELQSNQVLSHIQRGEPLTSTWTGKRKRKFQIQGRPAASEQMTRRSTPATGIRVFRLSFPVAFGLLLILATATIVLAYTIAGIVKLPFSLPGQQTNNFYNPQSGQAGIVGHKFTPTATVAVTMTPATNVRAETTPTPAVTAVKGPAIDYCPPSSGENPNQVIFICGYGFNAGDKVSLVLDIYGRNAPVVKGPYQVDEHGEFTAWYRYSCQNPPLAIYARDDSSTPATVVSNTLTHIPLAACSEPTPSATGGGH